MTKEEIDKLSPGTMIQRKRDGLKVVILALWGNGYVSTTINIPVIPEEWDLADSA